MRLRNFAAIAAVGLLYGCASDSSSGWGTPNPTNDEDPSGNGVSPDDDGTTGGVSPTGTSGKPNASVNPSTTVSPGVSGETETPGTPDPDYTPVINGDGSVARPMNLTGEAVTTSFARLTNEQWQRSVRDLLHLTELPVEESQFFEQIGAGATDFVNDQSRLQMSNTQWSQFQSAAETLAARVSATDQAMQAVHQGTDGQAFVEAFGLRAFRRPLTEAEVTRYMAVYDVGAGLSGSQSEFTKGAGLVVETMLQSPYFLYRTEIGAAGTPLDGYEKAAKLSLYLLRTTPSDALLAKAGRGELDSDNGFLNEARAMLATDEAAETFQAFHSELYEIHRFSSIAKSDTSFTEAVATELVESSEAFFDRIYREDFGLKEILTTRQGFVGPQTAKFYGVNQTLRMLTEVELPEERAGFFTQLPYLMYFARDLQSYGILRGVHLNTEVLCTELPLLDSAAPPLPEVEYTTSREYMEKGTVCGGTCHTDYINPLGFSMENFDGMGRVRELDNGVPVDTTGTYPFVGGSVAFTDAVNLMDTIANNEMAHECYSRYIASYGLGRMLGESDRGLVETLAVQSLSDDASTKDLVLSLIESPEFKTREGAN